MSFRVRAADAGEGSDGEERSHDSMSAGTFGVLSHEFLRAGFEPRQPTASITTRPEIGDRTLLCVHHCSVVIRNLLLQLSA